MFSSFLSLRNGQLGLVDNGNNQILPRNQSYHVWLRFDEIVPLNYYLAVVKFIDDNFSSRIVPVSS